MKKLLIIAIFLIVGFTLQSKANTSLYGGQFGFFYSSLAPYGTWIELDYGVTVWRPRIIRHNWSPYRYGQWIWTTDGWYWDSYEPFGWIAYHYGRWYFDDYYGWIWIPDDQWAPAWVEWRYDNNYIGWAPLPPYANFSISVGIHFSTSYHTPYHHWHFVNYNNFCSPHVSNYYVGVRNVNHFFSKTKYRTNYGFQDGRVVNRGVDYNYVRQRSGQDIRARSIRSVSNPSELRTRDDNNRNEVRAFIATRDQLSRGNSRNVEIKRGERNSTLQTSRVELGRTRDLNKTNRDINTEPRSVERSRTSDKKPDINYQRREVRRESSQGSLNRNVEVPKRTTEEKTDRRSYNRENNKRQSSSPAPKYSQPRQEQSREIDRGSSNRGQVERSSRSQDRDSDNSKTRRR